MTTQTTHRLHRYSHTIGLYSLQGRGFNNPVDMAFGKGGAIYVLNRAGPEVASRMAYKRVTICTADEEYLGEFSGGGVEDGQLMWPLFDSHRPRWQRVRLRRGAATHYYL